MPLDHTPQKSVELAADTNKLQNILLSGTLVLSVVILIGTLIFPSEAISPLQVLAVIGSIGLVLWVFRLKSRLSYSFVDNNLVITRASHKQAWPCQQITVHHSHGKLGHKIFGTNGMSYYVGTFEFSDSRYSRVQAIASNTKNGVLLEYQDKIHFLTPASPNDFIATLKQRGARV